MLFRSGAVVLFVNLMNFIISPIAELPGLLACRKAALGLVDKLAAALERSSSREGSETLNRLEHGIRLENVSFAYEPGKTVLHGINAEFEAGKAYALVGGSGSGKSTLLNLLMAAETNYSGHILADGIELSDISTESLYGTMAAIQQKFLQFTVEHLPRLAVAIFVINILRTERFRVQVDAGEVRKIHLPIHLQDHSNIGAVVGRNNARARELPVAFFRIKHRRTARRPVAVRVVRIACRK